jgi:hypothetical protein
MRKAPYILWCIALCSALMLVPARTISVRAQTAPLPTCSGTLNTVPMQGRYTGPWHSDADYHFAVFNTDLDLTITIDGTLDVTVSPDGQVSGVAHGTVDAPIHHDGIHDVSSGTGTISGIVQGVLTPGSSTVMLSQPVIAMQWGTFIPDGYTVPRSITMPNYQFPLAGFDCVSLHGSIAEQNFPTQFVVADGASGLTQAPGIGVATGTWSLSHVESATYTQLSQQVDGFIASANAALAPSNVPLSTAMYDTSVLQPLKALLAAIHQNPDVARCLLERLDAWVATTVPSLRLRAQGLGAAIELDSARQAFNLFHFSQLMQSECLVPDDSTLTGIAASDSALLDRAVQARDWSRAALSVRELILASDDVAGPAQRFADDLHSLLQTPLVPADKLDAARIAYALGDDTDARSTAPSGTRTESFRPLALVAVVKKHKRRKHVAKPTPTRTPTPTPKPTSTPTATATPKPVSLATTLASGAAHMSTKSTGGATPTFSWQPVPNAAMYVVILSGGAPAHLPYAWSGTATSVQYGDTSLSGLAGSETEAWPIPLDASGYTWSVLALDGDKHVIGVGLRLPI